MKPRRKGNISDRLMARVKADEASSCWNWTGAKIARGYGFMKINKNNYLVHLISFELHRGPIPEGILVCHTCDNRSCVNPDHLFLGTNLDNMADMVAKGRQNKLKGSAHGRAKLLEADVIAIRSSGGASRRKLAEKYGVTRGSIDDIMTGRSWAHLEGASNG